ncbi:MAG: acyltransferase family protein, partial [Clostridia bacterium]|nr:acyltransferase family protein [Clostridia bacterium]
MSDKRDKSIDLAKGIGIILVFIGHINFPETVVNIINAFHMPLFFVCSGYLYDSKYDRLSTRDFIKKKAKSLLFPYYFLGAIIVAYNSLISLIVLKNFTVVQLLKRILALLLGS